MTTFPLNLLFGLWCGGCLAACAGPRLADGPKDRPQDGKPAGPASARAKLPVTWPRLMQLPLLFAGLSVIPAATCLASQFPDWTWMYLIDPQRLPRLWFLGAGGLAGAGVAGGFALGIKGFQRYGGWPLRLALAILMLFYLGLIALGWRSSRLSVIGSFADFHAGGWLMQPVVSLGGGELAKAPSGLFYALVLSNLVVGASLFLVARTLLRKSEFIFAVSPARPPKGCA